jgi:hypothetical protein
MLPDKNHMKYLAFGIILTLLSCSSGKPRRFIANIETTLSCQKQLNRLLGQREERELIPISFFEGKMVRDKLRLSEDQFYEDGATYLGVANASKDGTHHYYLVIDNIRFDASGVFMKSSFKEFSDSSSALFSKGAIFKLQIDKASKEKLLLEMKNKASDLSCLHGVCRVLDVADIDLTGGEKIRARHVTPNLLTGQATQRGKKITSEVIFTHQDEIAHFINMGINADKLQAAGIYLVILPLAAGTTLAGTTIITVVVDLINED